MLTLGPLGFAAPLALFALAALPVIWWLLRATPPAPARVRFAAIGLLKGIQTEEETPAHTPWWLIALRLAAAALLILAFAEPVTNPVSQSPGSGPLLVAVDDSWAAAPAWDRRADTLSRLMAQARRGGRDVVLLTTTPAASARDLAIETADAAAARAAALLPRPFDPDRAAAATRLAGANLPGRGDWEVVWLTDGLAADAGDRALAEELARHGTVTVYTQAEAIALRPPARSGQNLETTIIRADTAGARTGTLQALGTAGRILSETPFVFEAGSNEITASLDMPLELRNAVDRLAIAGMASAGAATLLDDRWQRRTIGIVSAGGSESDQPLLSSLHYLRRATSPFAELREARPGGDRSEIAQLLSRPLSMLVTADVGQLVGTDADLVRDWVETGGTLVRFAGPRMAAGGDDLLPVRLRGGGRALGGALTWAAPQGLAPFDDESPFAGIAIPDDVEVHRQVLADPTADIASHTWARLTDGTPLVTAAGRGDGWIVLFHVSADTDWSSLPLSGLYVEMLQRLLNISRGTADSGDVPATRLLPPLRALDGYGRLVEPSPIAEPVSEAMLERIVPSPTHPPGLYGGTESFRALNLIGAGRTLTPLDTGDTTVAVYAQAAETALKPWLLMAAVVLLLIDGIVALALSGRLPLPALRRTASVLGATLIAAALLAPLAGTARAQASGSQSGDEIALLATLDTRLAYVKSGDPATDEMSRAGLAGLSQILRSRTAVEPADPLGVDVETDELAFYPLLYWPVLPGQRELSPNGLARVDAYMKRGGTILFDTMDHQRIEAIGTTPGNEALRRLLADLDVPPLEPVGEGHVLTKAFYLLRTFPGRWAGGDLWVEAQGDPEDSPGGLNQDGVTPLLIGSNDYAAAWAIDARGRPMAEPVPGGERQREMARRFGVNLVIYALTGNYKADQVHVPALLERLGQ